MAEQENFLIPGDQLSKENLTESIADKLHHNTTYRTSSDKIQKSMQDMIETMFPKKLSNETKGFQLGDGLSITRYDDGSGVISQRAYDSSKKLQYAFEVVIEFIKWHKSYIHGTDVKALVER